MLLSRSIRAHASGRVLWRNALTLGASSGFAARRGACASARRSHGSSAAASAPAFAAARPRHLQQQMRFVGVAAATAVRQLRLQQQRRLCSQQPKKPAAASEASSTTIGHHNAKEDGKKRSAIAMLRRIAWEIWPKEKGEGRLRAQVCVAVSCVFATKLIGIGVPYWFKGIVDALSSDPLVVAQAFNPLGTSILGLVLAHSLFRTLQFLTQEARGVLFAPIVQDAMRKLSGRVIAHLHNLPLSYHVNRQTGAVARSIERGTKAVDRLLNFALFHIVPTALELVLVSGVLYWQAGLPFAATALGAVGAYTVFTFQLSAWRISVRKEMNQTDNKASARLVDGLLNYETVKYFQNEAYELRRYDQYVRDYSKKAVLTTQSLGFLNFGQQFIFTAALGLSMAMSVTRVASGTMTLGDLVLVNTLLMQLSIPLHFLGTVYRELSAALTDMEKLFELLALETNEEADRRNNADTAVVPFEFKGGDIEFRDVRFNYKSDQQMLKGVSFKIPAGSSLGVVGPSGCGKSTLVKLLFKFYSPQSGQVLVDGQDVNTVESTGLRVHMGVIPQDTVLFNDTLMHNVRYGRLDATDDEVKDSVHKAGLHEAVLGFSEQYETRVGEMGVKLSGGEKQRVSIARTLLRGAPILLADEATSALDTRTETRAMAALRECSAPRALTSLIIAHRLSTVKSCDAILVLKEGEVHEYGTHEELLEAGGLYASLWEQQLQDTKELLGQHGDAAEQAQASSA